MAASERDVVRWTCSRVPYIIQQNHPAKNTIVSAMQEIQSNSPIWFCELNPDNGITEANYLYIEDDPNKTNNSQHIGMFPGKNLVNIHDDGWWALHELCHAVGLIHEQARADTKNFVHLDAPNDPQNLCSDPLLLTEYDRWSVMQYATDMGGDMYWLADPTGSLGASDRKQLDELDKVGLQTLYADNSGWQMLTLIPGADTNATPALAQYSQPNSQVTRLYFAWRLSSSSNQQMSYGWNDGSDNSLWNIEPTRLDDGATNNGPAMVEYGSALWACWAGLNDDGVFYSTFNGTTWSDQDHIDGGDQTHTSQSPAIATFKDKLWIAYAVDGELNYSVFDQSTGKWYGPTKLDGAGTSTAPTLSVFNNRLYAAWKGYDDDEKMYYSSTDGSMTGDDYVWQNQSVVPIGGTKANPALGAYRNPYLPENECLYLVWLGSGDDGLWWAYFDGTSWSSQARMNSVATNAAPTAQSGPTLARFDDRLYCGWRGANDHFNVNYLYIPPTAPKTPEPARQNVCNIP